MRKKKRNVKKDILFVLISSFVVVVAWVTLWYVILRVLGLRLFTYWGLSAEKAAAYK